MDYMDYSDWVAKRIAQLRLEKGVSARDMSISLGQSASYINKIENNAALPSMSVFFYICDYLEITPEQFFAMDVEAPETMKKISDNLKCLSKEQLEHVNTIIEDIMK